MRVFSFVSMLLLTIGTLKSYAQHPRQRVYANTVEKSDTEYLLLLPSGYVTDEAKAVDGNIATYAQLNSTVVKVLFITLGGEATIRLRFTGPDKPSPGNPVTVKLGLGGNVLSVLSGLTVQAVNGPGDKSGKGNEVGPVYSQSDLINVLGGENQIEFTFTPTVAYDGVKIKLGVPENSILSVGALASAKVFHAYFTKQADNVVCETPIDVLYGSTGNIVGGLNPIETPYNSIDKNENTAAILRTNVSALNKTYLTAIYPSLSKPGDSVRIVLREQNTGLLDLNLLAQNLKIRTYNDNAIAQELALNASLLRLRLLGGGSNKYVLTYPTSTPFNRVQVSIGEGLAQALSGLYVYEISRTAPKPNIQNPDLVNGSIKICEGTTANLSIQPTESGASYKWFDVSGNPITSGVNNNGTNLSVSGLPEGTHRFFVALYRNGCTDPASERTEVKIIVTPAATASAISISDVTICPGAVATIAAPTLSTGSTIASPVFKWYANADKTNPINAGTNTIDGIEYDLKPDGSLAIDKLAATKSFYVSVSGTDVCENVSGGLKEVIVNVNTTAQPTINLAGNQTVAEGGSITLTASSANALSYQWRKNGIDISGATNSSYTINNASATDAGNYSVIAYGTSGCISIASTDVNLQVGGFGSIKTVEGLNANGKIDSDSELTYKITITNTGTTALDNITITDPVPAGTSYIANSADNGGQENQNIVTWSNLSVPANSTLTVSFKVKVDKDLTTIDNIGNKATVSIPGQTDQTPEVTPIETEKTSTFTAVKTVSGLNSDNKIEAGSILTYSIAVTNTGNTTLDNISIVDPIPVGTSYVANSADNGGQESQNIVAWNINVGVGVTETVSFQVKVTDDLTNIASIANRATIVNLNDPTNTVITEVPPIETEQIRGFSAVKTDDITAGTKIKSGDEIIYTISVTNTGNVELKNISIVDPIPAGTTYVDNSADNGAVFSSNTLEWNIDVPVGVVPKTVSFRVRVNDDLTGVSAIGNKAVITDPQDPNNPKTPEVPGTDTEQISSFEATKTLISGFNNNNKIEPETELTYHISVENKGNVTLDNITITDPIPNGTSYVEGSASHGGSLINNALKWVIDVPVGNTPVTVSFKLKVGKDLTGVASISNTATVEDDTTPTNPAEQNPKTITSGSFDTEQNSSFEVRSWIESTDNSGKATPNTELIVYVEVTNTGNMELLNLDIKNPLPAYTNYVSGGIYDAQNNIISDVILSIPTGESRTVSFRVKTDESLSSLVTSIDNVTTVTVNGISKRSDASLEVSCTGAVVTSINVTGNNNGNICINGANTAEIIIETAQASPTFYLYSGGNIVDINTTGVFTVPVVPGNSYTFSGAVSASGLCETAANERKEVTFTVSSLPSAPSVANTTVNVCENSSAVLEVTNPLSGFTYNWYNANGDLQGSNTIFTTANISSNTIFYVEAVSTNGCISTARTAVNVNIIAAPVAPLSASVTNGVLCKGSSALLKVDNPVSGIIYRWYKDLTGGTVLHTGETYATETINDNTTYYVESVDQLTSCSSTMRTAVNISVAQPLEAPVVSIQSQTSNSITYVWTAVANALGYEISLDEGITWMVPSAGNNATVHTITNLVPTQNVSINVRAVGSTNCQTSLHSFMRASASNPLGNEVFVPNTFTPNNDGQNDYFRIYGNTISAANINVFNQWGQLIFQSGQLNNGWDGTYKGQPQPTGVYVYQAEITFTDGSKTVKKGTVTLIR